MCTFLAIVNIVFAQKGAHTGNAVVLEPRHKKNTKKKTKTNEMSAQ